MLKSRIPQIIGTLGALTVDALGDAADEIIDDARARIDDVTGDLSRSLHTSTEREGVYVVADAYYAAMVEYGTSHSAPHPFLVPAVEENRDTIERAARARLGAL